jgi:hypothetical protein
MYLTHRASVRTTLSVVVNKWYNGTNVFFK